MDGNGKVKGMKRHVHDTAAAALSLDRAAAAGWKPERVEVDGTDGGARMA